MKQAKLTRGHRDAFYALGRESRAPKEAQLLEVARKALLRVVRPIADKEWPKKDLVVLEKYGCTATVKALTITVGAGCKCERIDLPLDEGSEMVLPREGTYGSVARLRLDDDSSAVELAIKYVEARDASKEADEALQRALGSLIDDLVVPGRSLDGLATLESTWPDPRVKALADQIRSGLTIIPADEAAKAVAEAFRA